MTSVKIKFRASSVIGKRGVIYYQIIHNRVTRQITTAHKIYPEEWDESTSKIISTRQESHKTNNIESIKESIKLDTNRLLQIIISLDGSKKTYTSDSVVERFEYASQDHTLFRFAQDIIIRLIELKRVRTSETYIATINSFMRFRHGEDILLSDISSDVMMDYEAYLRAQGLTMNSTSFYIRILRAIYNQAVERELIEQRYPFKRVYTGIDKTVKRALQLKDIKKIKELDMSDTPGLLFARDLFLFSFYTRGMSFVDITYLRKANLKNQVISYRRRKTGQQLYIKLEQCMQEILDRYPAPDSEYLFPIIKDNNKNDRTQYKNMLGLINRKLKTIGEIAEIPTPLTLYVARHSWASIAKNSNIPLSVISEGMGHNSETTTQIYLASLDADIVDQANNLILKLL